MEGASSKWARTASSWPGTGSTRASTSCSFAPSESFALQQRVERDMSRDAPIERGLDRLGVGFLHPVEKGPPARLGHVALEEIVDDAGLAVLHVQILEAELLHGLGDRQAHLQVLVEHGHGPGPVSARLAV